MSSFTTADGRRLAYRREGSGPVLVCHPGGPKVIDALEHAFGLRPGVLRDARAVLRDYGNMSAASVLFVLERMLERTGAAGTAWGRALMIALGPGFTAGFALLGDP